MAASGLRYTGKVTIVTGGACGIGRAVVEKFVRSGADVVFADIMPEEGQALETALTAEGNGRAVFRKCDVTAEDELETLVAATVERFGKLDCCIAVAGNHPPAMTIDDVTSQDFFALAKLNIMHPMLLAKFSMPHLRKTRGNVIFMSSLASSTGQRGAVTYSATKGALVSMTRTLAIDEGKNGVRINCVSPAGTRTPLLERWFDSFGEDRDRVEQANQASSVLNRIGDAEEVASACLFLASEGTHCTGIDLNVSGGCELGLNPQV